MGAQSPSFSVPSAWTQAWPRGLGPSALLSCEFLFLSLSSDTVVFGLRGRGLCRDPEPEGGGDAW